MEQTLNVLLAPLKAGERVLCSASQQHPCDCAMPVMTAKVRQIPNVMPGHFGNRQAAHLQAWGEVVL